MSSITKREISPRTYGRVAVALSAVALFSTAGGPAWAQAVITGREIADDTITNADIADDDLDASSLAPGAVGTSELAYGAVRSDDVAWGSLGSSAIADGSLTGLDVQDESLSNVDLSWNSVGSSEIQDLSVSKMELDNGAVTRRSMDIRSVSPTFTSALYPNRCVMGATSIPSGSLAVFEPQIEHAGAWVYAYSGLVATAYSTVYGNNHYMMVQLCNFTGAQWTPPSGGLKVKVSYIP